MTKEEIFDALETLDFPRDSYIAIGGASLVVQDIISSTSDIDLSCSKEFYETIDWPIVTANFGWEIKSRDIFDIGTDFYDPSNVVWIHGFCFAVLDACYQLKMKENRDSNQEVIEKLEKILKK